MIARRGATIAGAALLALTVVASCGRAPEVSPREPVASTRAPVVTAADGGVATWTRLPFFTLVPGMAHATDTANARVVLQGGSYGRAGLARAVETWSYASGALKRIAVDPQPSERRDGCLAFEGDHGVLYGGQSLDILTDEWTLANDAWTPLATSGPSPGPQQGAPFLSVPSTLGGGLLLLGLAPPSSTVVLSRLVGSTWSTVAASGAPPTTNANLAAYAGALGVVLLVGGDPTHTWRWDGATWTELSALAGFTLPPQRLDAQIAYDPSRAQLVVFGGQVVGKDANGVETHTALGDTWLLGEAGYTQVASGGPPARSRGVMDYDPSAGAIALLAGERNDDDDDLLPDAWTWDGAAWSLVSPGLGLTRRDEPAVAYDDETGEVVLWGETIGNGALATNDMWRLGDAGWSVLATPHAPPPLRWASLLSLGASGLLLVGTDAADALETWTFHAGDWALAAPAIPGLEGPALTFDGARPALFGGRVNGALVATTYALDGGAWILQSPGETPVAQFEPMAAYDEARGEAVFFCGSLGAGPSPNETWVLSRGVFQKRLPAAPPPARRFGKMTYDRARKRVVLFGGDASSIFVNDLWEWDGAEWTARPSSLVPPKLAYHAMTYDAARSRVLVVGGEIEGVGATADTWSIQAHGEPCAVGGDCDTGACVDGVCCTTTACGVCATCGATGATGECTPVRGAADPGSCDGDRACDATGACRTTQGSACSDDGACLTGHCVDGVCCASACDQTCEACAESGAVGRCIAVTGKPRGARPACPSAEAGASPCAAAACDGTRTDVCAGLARDDVTCRAASCDDGVAHAAWTCDGQGGCHGPGDRACAPYACGARACDATCLGDGECAAGYACESGACVAHATCDGDHTLRSSAGDAVDCAPYRCVSGGTCRASCGSSDDCAAPSVCDESGKCVPVPSDPAAGGCAASPRGVAGDARRAWAIGLAAIAALGAARRRQRRDAR